MVIKQNKETRKKFKAMRESLSVQEIEAYSLAATDNILALLDDFKGANIFLCFNPFGAEINLKELYQQLLDNGKSLYFPKSDVKTHQLTFLKIQNLEEDFIEGTYGILEPKDNLEALTDFNQQIISITPGLIFDEQGNRCGYGAGFYDRYFASNPEIIKIGVAFDFQVVKSLETNSWDIPLDYIVTNNRLIKRGK